MAATIQSSDLGNDNQSQLDQQNQGTQQQAGQGGATPSAGNAQGGGYQQQTGQPSGGSTGYNPNKQQGSGYTNIQKVLGANQGNQLGSAVGGGITNEANQANQNVTQAQQQFNQQTQQNQANTGQNSQLVQNVLGNTAQYAPGGANQAQGQQFQQLISGQYSGPTQLNNAQQLQNQASDVGQLGQATGSQAGQIGLLQRFVGNPQYTSGQQNLDQLLLGQTGQPQLANARRAALQLQGQVGSALTGAQATGQQQQQQAQQFGQNVQNQFGQTVAGINTGLQQQATTAQQGADTAYQKALTDLQSGTVSQDEANMLGLTNGEQVTGNALQSVGQFLTENPNKATAQNVANGQNYAQLDALRQLGGTYAPSAAQSTLQQYAGQNANANQFQNQQAILGNQQGFNTANTAQINNYNSEVNPALSGLQTANQIEQLERVRNLGGPQGVAAGQQLAAQYAGALGGSSGQQAAWAQNNYYQNQLAYNNALAAANSAVGGLQNITITPQQAALQQIAQNGGNS